MATRKTGQVPAKLTYKQERFIHEYVKNGGNGTRAAIEAGYSMHCAAELAYEHLRKPHIKAAIETWRETWREAARVERDEIIKILAGMATATQADFTQVLKNPEDPKNYKHLGYKIHALQGAKKSLKFGNEIKLADKKGALNDLWEKLGYDQESGGRDRLTIAERILGAAGNLRKSRGIR